MIAPMALKLREQGVPLRIVYLGHRDGTALVVHADSPARSLKDLRGQRIAIPNRMSNQYLLLFKGLKDAGMTLSDVKFVEMPPPDMPAALATKSVEAIIAGEPFMGQAELDGYGRVLHQAKELWPNFISCVLVVEEKQIAEQPARVQELVTGIARSGKWLEGGMDNRMAASDAVATNYYNQDPRLLRFVLSKPPDRVTYGNLRLAKGDFDQIEALAIEAKLLERPVGFDHYADPQFSDKTDGATPYEWQPSSSSSSSSSSAAAAQPTAGASH
jgi:NitT/TauT family transport system substrate-binding protein